jgi:hypothetical protein
MTKRFVKVLLTLGIVIGASIIFSNISNAALSISASKSTVEPGESFKVTVSVSSKEAGAIDLSATNGTLSSSKVDLMSSSSATVTCTAGNAGTVTIKGSGKVANYDNETEGTQSASKSVTVKAKETEKPKEDNNTGNTSSDPKQNPGTEPQEKQETKSGEYHLSSLSTSVGTLKPSFNTYNQDYTLEFPADYDMSELKSIDVSAKATHSKASVSGTGAFEVKEGDNEIIVNCTAENGKVLAYRIKFKKEVKTQQSDLRLKTFSITKLRSEDNKQVLAKLNEEFKPDVFEYTMDLDEETKELNIDFEIEEKFKDKINVEITGNKDLKPGENIITIKLTSKDDEKVTTTYTIRVNKAGAVEETVPETKTSGSLNIKLIIIIVGSIVGLLVLILIILLIVNHIQKKKAKESMKADDDNNFVGGDNGFDADIGHDIKPVGVAGLDEESDSNYDYLGRDEESEDDEDDEKRFGAAGYNTIHQHYDEDIEDDEGYASFDDTDLPEGTVSEHMINAKLNGEADELKRRYEIDELQEEIADELKDKKTKRKGRGRRFK